MRPFGLHLAILKQLIVLFECNFLLTYPPPPARLIPSQPLNSLSVPRFCQALTAYDIFLNKGQGLVSGFNSFFMNILGSVAPVRYKKLKYSSYND